MTIDACRRWACALPLTVAALAGCQRSPAPAEPFPPEPPVLPALVRPANVGREHVPALVRANNAFALALYQRLRMRPGNLVVSPAALSAGLTLVHAGARGETARQIARVLHLPDGFDRFDGAHAALAHELNDDGEDHSFQIRLANAVWVQNDYPLLDAYRATLHDVLALPDEPVDFAGRRDEACRVINAWTERRTGGRIAGMLRPDDLPPHTRLISTSALYFRADWQRPFQKKLTRPAPFHLASGETVDVPTMNAHSYSMAHGYFDGGSFQALALPCGARGEFAMVVLLPRKVDGLAGLEAALTPEALDSWWPRFREPEEIIIALPKYRVRGDVSLGPLLSEMGMPLAFDDRADFSGVNGKSRDLFLSAARHAAFIDVHEVGIEAAAAMAVINPDSFGEEPPVFRADHPFLFLVRDTRTGCIVFLGRVVNPLN